MAMNGNARKGGGGKPGSSVGKARPPKPVSAKQLELLKKLLDERPSYELGHDRKLLNRYKSWQASAVIDALMKMPRG